MDILKLISVIHFIKSTIVHLMIKSKRERVRVKVVFMSNEFLIYITRTSAINNTEPVCRFSHSSVGTLGNRTSA